jgi:hypothetical protein
MVSRFAGAPRSNHGTVEQLPGAGGSPIASRDASCWATSGGARPLERRSGAVAAHGPGVTAPGSAGAGLDRFDE